MDEPAREREHGRTGESAVLDFRGARVVRGRREVLRVDAFHLDAGETMAVLGPNGAGKSTMLLAGALLIPVATGEVRLFGEAPARRGDRVRLRRGTASVFQDAGLLDMPVRANVETALGIQGVGQPERRERAGAWLARLGVAHLARARPHTLSGGEAQRVALARAFAVRPRLLFLDEPFSSLDSRTRGELVGDLYALLAAEGTAALIATHDHGEAQLLADRTAVLLAGRVVQVEAAERLFRAPATPEVAAFLGYSIVEAGWLRARTGAEWPGAHLYLPPDALTLDEPPLDAPPSAGPSRDGRPHRAGGDAPAAFDATVVAVEGGDGDARLVVEAGQRLALHVPVARVRALGLRAGAPVRVRIDPARVIRPASDE